MAGRQTDIQAGMQTDSIQKRRQTDRIDRKAGKQPAIQR